MELLHCHPADITLLLRLDQAEPSLALPSPASPLPYQILDIQETTQPKKRLNTKADSFQIEGTVKHKLEENLQDLDRLLAGMNQEKREEHVVRVGGLSPEVDSQMLFNLFCNYGNITRILSGREQAYVYFENENYAQCALNYLTGHRFFGRRLELSLGEPGEETGLQQF